MSTHTPPILAISDDIPAWRALAVEVEPLFGPMVGRVEFEAALVRKIAQGQALCVRAEGGPAGAPLLGGLLWSAHPPLYRIGWLAVSAAARRRGVGRRLVTAALEWALPPATVEVVTFGADNPGGMPARHFYQQLGFVPAEAARDGPEGGSRQVYRLTLV
jgi:GNAT superfamily N-acetyltransferase